MLPKTLQQRHQINILPCCPSSSLLTLSLRAPLTGSSKGGMLCKKRFSRGGEAPGASRTSSPTTNEPEIMHHELSTSLPPTNKSYQEISQRNLSSGPLNLAVPNKYSSCVWHCNWWRWGWQSDNMNWLANDGRSCERFQGASVKCCSVQYSTQLPHIPACSYIQF